MRQIRQLVGDITAAPFEFVDFAVTDCVGLFVPVSGQCYYAVSPEHTHPSYSFVVSFDEFCSVRIDGRIELSRPGTFCAFSPGVPHQELPSETPARYVAILIAANYLHRQLKHYGVSLPELRGDTFATTPRLLDALREFMSEFEEKAKGHEALLAATGQKITHHIIRQILGYSQGDERSDLRMAANHVVEFMHTHLSENLTLTELARVGRLSISQFSRVFRTEVGMAPMQYMMELRLVRARRLLRDSSRSITEIALATGFNSPSYFSRCFMGRFSVSPSDFRRTLGR